MNEIDIEKMKVDADYWQGNFNGGEIRIAHVFDINSNYCCFNIRIMSNL